MNICEWIFAKLRESGMKSITVHSGGTYLKPGPRTAVEPDNPRVPVPDFGMDWFNSHHTDVQTGILYSQLTIEPGDESAVYTLFGYGLQTNLERFTSPRGRPLVEPSYSLAETNLQSPFALPSWESFVVRQLGVIFSPAVSPNLRSRFCSEHGVSLILGQKIYKMAPLSTMFSIGNPVEPGFSVVPVCGLAALDEIPVMLLHGGTFKMVLEASQVVRVESTVKLWGILTGFHGRMVQ